jgi:hypothetical protein
MSLQQNTTVIMNTYIQNEITRLLKCKDRYEKGIVALQITCHLMAGLTTIFSFLSITIHPMSIAAGVLGVSTSAFIAFNQYLYKQMQNNDSELNNYLKTAGVNISVPEINPPSDDDAAAAPAPAPVPILATQPPSPSMTPSNSPMNASTSSLQNSSNA